MARRRRPLPPDAALVTGDVPAASARRSPRGSCAGDGWSVLAAGRADVTSRPPTRPARSSTGRCGSSAGFDLRAHAAGETFMPKPADELDERALGRGLRSHLAEEEFFSHPGRLRRTCGRRTAAS